MQSVLRSLQVLEAVAAHQPARVGELVPIVNLPKSTVQRCLATLAEAGWLQAVDGDLTRWQLSDHAIGLLQPAPLPDVDLRACAFEPMQDLCSSTGETVHLLVPHGVTHHVVLDRAESPRSLRTVIALGTVIPTVGSSAGLMSLALGSQADIDEAFAAGYSHRGGVTGTPTSEQLATARSIIESAREKGYAKRLAWEGDVIAIGSVIRDKGGRIVAGVSLSIPVSRYHVRNDDDWGDAVIVCVDRISRALGYRPVQRSVDPDQ